MGFRPVRDVENHAFACLSTVEDFQIEKVEFDLTRHRCFGVERIASCIEVFQKVAFQHKELVGQKFVDRDACFSCQRMRCRHTTSNGHTLKNQSAAVVVREKAIVKDAGNDINFTAQTCQDLISTTAIIGIGNQPNSGC